MLNPNSSWNIETLEHSKEPASMQCGTNGNGGGRTARGGENTYNRRGNRGRVALSDFTPCAGLEIAKKSQIWKKQCKNHQFICFKDCHCSKKIHIIKGKVQVGEMVFHFLLITVITTITIIVITITIIIISMRTTARQKEVWRGDVEQ